MDAPLSADHKIHLFGASGSGTSTLGAALAQRLSLPHLDVDDFYWRPTNPPFVEKQQPAQRLLDLNEAMTESQGWILSGSLCGWGDELIPRFSHAVFLFLQPHLRQQRLRLRERQRHGDRILPGQDMYEIHTEFMAWAARYDSAGLEQRSRRLHQQWSQKLPCPLLRLDSDQSIDLLTNHVVANLQ